jgi:soluble calcium-activated nucleotidase 1
MLSDARAVMFQVSTRMWHFIRSGKSETQKRAVIFMVIFGILVMMRVFLSSEDPTSAGNGLLYQRFDHHRDLVADVPQFAVLAVADNDERNDVTDSKASGAAGKMRYSALVEGTLSVVPNAAGKVGMTIEWAERPHVLRGGLLQEGRGMELSTLQYWKGARLFTCDDHTGVLYELAMGDGVAPKLFPRHILADGDGDTARGMKCEWSTSKGDYLYVGGTGQPWVDAQGAVVSRSSMWIKTISPTGVIRNIDWTQPYETLKRAMGVGEQGYLTHECALWSSKLRRWIFIPRHVSNTKYVPGNEREHGSTAILISDATFTQVLTVQLQGTSEYPKAGVTDCKFIPNGREREIIIVKIDEGATDKFRSFVSVINTDGEVLMPDVPMPKEWKFEGIELRPLILSEK